MSAIKILIVDDNDQLREMTTEIFETKGYHVAAAKGVNEALQQIILEKFDVLLTDLHMPFAGDGYAVVTAMRHAQPDALTIVVSGYPDIEGSMAAIALQADQILMKPVNFPGLLEEIRQRLQNRNSSATPRKCMTVGAILKRDSLDLIKRWMGRVATNNELTTVPLEMAERSGHLPLMLENIITRLQNTRELGAPAKRSPEAVAHGVLRFSQGYTAPLIVQESRLLQVCIFETIQKSLLNVDFSLVLPDVMLIADEVDSQLTQCIAGFWDAQMASAPVQS